MTLVEEFRKIVEKHAEIGNSDSFFDTLEEVFLDGEESGEWAVSRKTEWIMCSWKRKK